MCSAQIDLARCLIKYLRVVASIEADTAGGMVVGQEVARGQGCGQEVVRGRGSCQNFRIILLMFIMLIIL